MNVSELKFEIVREYEDDKLFCVHTDQGRITVSDRMTGFGNGQRDIETGFKDNNDEFWLASGMFDIRDFPDLSIIEAIEKIKKNANTCIGI